MKNWQEVAAQLWCKPETSSIQFDACLCNIVAVALEEAYKEGLYQASCGDGSRKEIK